MAYPEKNYFKVRGTIHFIGEQLHIKRDGIPDLYKRVLTLETPDGQVLYLELRNGKLSYVETCDLAPGSTVEIEYLFQGSEKSGKRYNNLYIHTLKNI